MRRGYLAFNKGLGSNHQGLWLDIPASALWGTLQHHYTLAKARRLQCKEPQVMKKYNDYLQAHLQEKQIFNRVNTLVTKVTGTMSAKQEHDFKQLD